MHPAGPGEGDEKLGLDLGPPRRLGLEEKQSCCPFIWALVLRRYWPGGWVRTDYWDLPSQVLMRGVWAFPAGSLGLLMLLI